MQLKANPWLLWLLGALLFFSEYFVRTSSSVMVGDLMHEFAVDAIGIGTLSAFFYYPYTLMQIPVGLIVDRFPTGKILTFMALMFAVGCLLFANTNQLMYAEAARAIMGCSAAFAFVGTLKLVTESFDAKVLGFLAGSTQAIGMLGAATGEGPVAVFVQSVGWRIAMRYMAAFISCIAILLLVFAWNSGACSKIKHQVVKGIKQAVFDNKQALLNALFAGLIYAPTLAFGELWGVKYLETVHKLSYSNAAAALSWIFIGWGFGGPLQGLISDKIGRRKPLLCSSAISSLILMLIILQVPMAYNTLIFSMFCYGIANSGLVVSYAISGEINPDKQTGTTIAFTNMASVLLGTCCQPLVGWALVYYWSGLKDGAGSPIYDANAYQHAMLFLPMLLVLAVIVSFLIKETNCKKEAI